MKRVEHKAVCENCGHLRDRGNVMCFIVQGNLEQTDVYLCLSCLRSAVESLEKDEHAA